MIPTFAELAQTAEWIALVVVVSLAIIALLVALDTVEGWWLARRHRPRPQETETDDDAVWYNHELVRWRCERCGHDNLNYGYACPRCYNVGPEFPGVSAARARLDAAVRADASVAPLPGLPPREPWVGPRLSKGDRP